MNSNADKDIARVRLQFIDLVKSFFLAEPDAEKLRSWRKIFSALSEESVNKNLDAAISRMVQLLKSGQLEDFQQEYYNLFGNPFSQHGISLSASFFKDGKSHGQTLADFRGFLGNAGVAKTDGITEAEDTLPIMIDCLASLIEFEKESPDQARKMQSHLVRDYLAPLAINLEKAFRENEKADFYEACGQFLLGYTELDLALFEPV